MLLLPWPGQFIESVHLQSVTQQRQVEAVKKVGGTATLARQIY